MQAVVPYLPSYMHLAHDSAIVCAECISEREADCQVAPSKVLVCDHCFVAGRKCRAWAFEVHVEAASADQANGMIGYFETCVWECAIRVVICICGPCHQLLATPEPREVYHSPIKLLSSQWSQMS